MPTEELESEKRSTAAPTSKPVRRLAGLRRIGAAFAWLAGVGAILGGLTGYWSTYRTVTTELLTPAASKPMASRFSIAVLPFANLGGDSRQDYLADGITDSLTTDLSRALPGSTLRSPTKVGSATCGGSAASSTCVTHFPAASFPTRKDSASTQSSSTRRLEHSFGQNDSMSSEPISWKSRTKSLAAWQEPSA